MQGLFGNGTRANNLHTQDCADLLATPPTALYQSYFGATRISILKYVRVAAMYKKKKRQAIPESYRKLITAIMRTSFFERHTQLDPHNWSKTLDAGRELAPLLGRHCLCFRQSSAQGDYLRTNYSGFNGLLMLIAKNSWLRRYIYEVSILREIERKRREQKKKR